MQTSPKAQRIEIALLAAITLLARLFRLGWHPLWVDELYSHQVSAQSLGVIIRNSLYESHPPLYYILLKFSTLFNLWHSEIGLRWLSAAAGTAMIIVFYAIAVRLVDRRSARILWFIMLLSPGMIFYGQEVRSYAVEILIATITLWLVHGFTETANPSRRQWMLWGAVSVMGVYLGYSYLLVFAAQALFLLWHFRRDRGVWITLTLASLGIAPLIPLLLKNLSNDINTVFINIPLNVRFMLAALLAGEPARYGFFWGSVALPVLIGLPALVGAVKLMGGRAGGGTPPLRGKFGAYLLLQIMIPLIVYFVIIDRLLHIEMPNYQSRQFFVILPALFLLVAHGFQTLHARLPKWVSNVYVVAALLVIAAGSLFALADYWNTTKSPEGQAARLVRAQLQPGDAVVSLGNSLDAAAGYYLPPGTPIYLAAQLTNNGYRFDDNPLILREQVERAHPFSLEDVRAHPRIWILSDNRHVHPVVPLLTGGCLITLDELFPPFEVILVKHCAP